MEVCDLSVKSNTLILAYHHGPGDGGEPLMDAEQDEEKEDDGEEPQSDGHKQDPAVHRVFPVGAAGNQRPIEQPYYL